MQYAISKAAGFLYSIGVSYHATGYISQKNEKTFDYYKVDNISQDQKEKILQWCKDSRFFNSSAQYAPELKNILIAFPKAAFYRQNKKGE